LEQAARARRDILKRACRQVAAIYPDNADHYFSYGADRLAWKTALYRFISFL
jgi:hypothetical protein